jgi:C-terminal peptidase prc
LIFLNAGFAGIAPVNHPRAMSKGQFFMTKVKWTGLLAGLVAVFALVLPIRAEEAPAAHPFVVLVGVSKYADKQIKERPHAEADAKALYDLFTNKAYLGVEPDHVKLFLGSADAERKSEPATHENVLKSVHWVVEKAGANDPVIFAFIGQGAPMPEASGLLCYLTADSTIKNRAKDALSALEISRELDKLKSQRFVALLDVSFHGWAAGPEKIAEPTLGNSPYKEFRRTDENEEKGPAPGRMVFLATNGLSQSLDLEKHGLFTQVLINGLKGAADTEGYEADGLVTVEELAEYFEKELPRLARKEGKTDDQKRQMPHVLRSRESHFVVTRNPAVTAKVAERVSKLESLGKDKKLAADMVTEGRKLLERMPKLKAQQDLRKDYQNLVDGKIAVDEFTKKRGEILTAVKMKRSEAMTFASKVIQSTEIIREGYLKDVNQGELVGWAIRGLYRQLDEKIPAEVRGRLDKAKNMNERELTALLADVRERLGQREDLSNHKDLDISLQRMLHHLDPYTTYIDPDALAHFEQEIMSNFPGIGIQIREKRDKGGLLVISPLKGSPAYRAGIKAGDLITKIIKQVDEKGNPLKEPQEFSTKGMTSDDAVKQIKGKPGTKVKLVVEREGVDHPLEFEVTRAVVQVETVLGLNRKDNDEWNYYVDPANKICYVRLKSFARNTYSDLKRVVSKLSRQGINGFILDLRFNPGGLLDSAVDVSDLFIDDGLIVTVRDRVGKEKQHRGVHEGSYLNFPMVCLVNGGSASGSEIVSACLQDHERAIVMGERSYGKGSVQNIQPFEGGQLKLTTASFWRPSGRNLHRLSTAGRDEDTWGVTPNRGYTIHLDDEEHAALMERQMDSEIIQRHDLAAKKADKKTTEFKDRQLEKAVQYLRSQIRVADKVASKQAG